MNFGTLFIQGRMLLAQRTILIVLSGLLLIFIWKNLSIISNELDLLGLEHEVVTGNIEKKESKWLKIGNDDLSPLPAQNGLYLSSYFAFVAEQFGRTTPEYQHYYSQAIKLIEQAQQQRPFLSQAYVMEANYAWAMGKPYPVISALLNNAQLVGYYERDTVLNSLRFYLAFWPELSDIEKVQTVSYLFEMEKYNIHLGHVESILTDEILFARACALFSFNQTPWGYCQRPFSRHELQ